MKHFPCVSFSGMGAGRSPECSCGWRPTGNFSKSLAQEVAIRHADYANRAEEVQRGDLEDDS